MKRRLLLTLFLLLAATLGGCAQPALTPATNFTFDRGVRLLAAGSPKSAIPFLTQAVAAQPDGPEPVAMLALAYALDMQDARAINQARLVRRAPGSLQGWEFVAAGIAEMIQHHPDDAIRLLQPVAAEDLLDNPPAQAARQWLILAQILNGQQDDAIGALQVLSNFDHMQSSTNLWIAIIYQQQNKKAQAALALQACAKAAVSRSGQQTLAQGSAALAEADDQALYDAAIASLAGGDMAQAEELFSRVRELGPDAGDAPVWLAMIAGIKDNWQAARNQLQEATEAGPVESRGLASQLFSVVCALEDRPEGVVQYTLQGQRLLGRSGSPSYMQEQRQPEPVWFSDQMK